MAKSKIKIKEKNKGRFTKSAKAAGKSVQEHAHDVMNNPNATALQRKRANFAIQAKKWHSKELGGLIDLPIADIGKRIPFTDEYGNQIPDDWGNNTNYMQKFNQYLENQGFDGTDPIISGETPYFTGTGKATAEDLGFVAPEEGNLDLSQSGEGNNPMGIINTIVKAGSQIEPLARNAWTSLGNHIKNRRTQAYEAKQLNKAYRQPYNTNFSEDRFGTNQGLQLFEMGGINNYKAEYGANVEVEDKELIQLPNGLSDTIYGKTHNEGGEKMNLPQDSKVFSEKLKIPINGKKKSFSKIAKPFETKKDIENLNSPFSTKINKDTAELNIKLKNNVLDGIFEIQENSKMSGLFGKKVQQETINNYEMKYGGKLPKAQDGVFTGTNPNVDWKTFRLQESEKQRRDNFLPFKEGEKPEYYGSQPNLDYVFDNFEQTYGKKLPQGTNEQKLKAIRDYQNLLTPSLSKDYKLNFARGNNALYEEFTKQKGYKKQKDETKESQNFYDWAKNSGKLTDDYANKGLWGHEYYNVADLPFTNEEFFDKNGNPKDPDWSKVGNYYVDRSADPNQPITYYKQKFISKSKSPLKDDEIKLQSRMEGKTDKTDLDLNIPQFFPMGLPVIGGEEAAARFQIPDRNVPFRRISPQQQLNEINRNTRAGLSLLGNTPTDASNISNLLTQANIQGQQAINTTNQQNIQNQMNIDQINTQLSRQRDLAQLQEDVRFTENIAKRKGLMQTEANMNKAAYNQNWMNVLKEQRDKDFVEKIYPSKAWENVNFQMYDPTKYTLTPKEKKEEVKKYGGKIKLKSKSSK